MNIMLIAAALVIFTLVGIYRLTRYAGLMEEASREQNTVIMDTMSDSMRDMATESLRKYVIAEARIIDGEFWTMRHDLEILARQVQMVLEEPSAYSPVEVPLPSQADAGKLTLQLLYSDKADTEDPELKEQILRIGGLRNMMLEMVEGGDSLLDCMVSLPGGASSIVDRTPESKVGPNGVHTGERRQLFQLLRGDGGRARLCGRETGGRMRRLRPAGVFGGYYHRGEARRVYRYLPDQRKRPHDLFLADGR